MLRRFPFIMAPLVALVGCGLLDKDAQYDDPRNPYYKKAQQDLDANNLNDAAQDYEDALIANPKLAGAHFALGQIYGDKLNNPVTAIYHYRLYLAFDPNSDKAAEVKALIDKESLQFAASLPNTAPQNAEAFAQLQADNANLKKQVDDLTKQVANRPADTTPAPVVSASSATSAPATETASTSAPATAAMSPAATPAGPVTAKALPVTPADALAATDATNTAGARSYKVVSGDSFWKIAKKMYPGHTKEGLEKIKEANKDIVPNEKDLKIGQVLVIP